MGRTDNSRTRGVHRDLLGHSEAPSANSPERRAVAILVVDPDSEADTQEAWDLNTRLVRRALAMGGTCTGEHGIGLGKREFLVEEFGQGSVNVMPMRAKNAKLTADRLTA